MHERMKIQGVEIIPLPAPPDDFDPMTADESSLLKYGLPPRPADDAKALAFWEEIVRQKVERVEPVFGVMRGKRTRPSSGSAEGSETSPNWSGCVVFAPSGARFRFVQAQWTVPGVSPPAADGTFSYCSTWVGIDGDGGSTDVFQTGVTCDVVKSGVETDSAFWFWSEWYPLLSAPIDILDVFPGDLVYCWVFANSSTTGIISCTNRTRNKQTSFQISAPNGTTLSGNCAEWITERPQISGVYSRLASYTEVLFQQAASQTFDGSVYTHPTPDEGNSITMTDDGTDHGKVLSKGTVVDQSTVKCDYVDS